VKPSDFFNQIDPTPGAPGINRTITMPGYPKGSPFMLDGLMASTPGYQVAEQLNAMSAWQNTLAPPPNVNIQNTAAVERGAAIFTNAGCVSCHSGRTLTNHRVIAQDEVGTQPSRASTLAPFARVFTAPQTYPNSVSVPLPSEPPILNVPTDITPVADQQLAYAVNNPAGGYKVPSLIGLYVTAPYLHDGGVAASADALKQETPDAEFAIANPDHLGMPGTVMQFILPDPAASLRVLVDRKLRQKTVAVNRANEELGRSHIDGSGHNYWVDPEAGFTVQDQTDLIQFLLSLDDDPQVIPAAQ
jgi:hypothetical protein